MPTEMSEPTTIPPTQLTPDFANFHIFGGSEFPAKKAVDGSWGYVPLISTRDGGQRVWQVGFDASDNNLVTSYGKVGGKMQTARSEVKPMGKRNHSEQSIVAVNSKLTVKMSKDGFVFSDAAVAGSAPWEKTTHVPEGAADPCDRPRPVPMLARDFGSLKKPLEFPVAVQPKLDGVRCMIDAITDTDGSRILRLTSRGGKDFKHLETLLVDEALRILEHLPEMAVLDGELVAIREGAATGCDFQLTTSLVRTQTISDAAREKMRFQVFGLYLPTTPDATYHERAALLETAFQNADAEGELSRFTRVQHYMCDDMEAVFRLHAEFVQAGEEGAMIYALNGVYAPNQRGYNLVKYKVFDEFEGEVIGVERGKGREKNAALVTIRCPNGKVVTMHPEGSIAERERWLADPSLVVGKIMTYSCQGLTDAGVPRFPVAKCIRDYE